MATAKKTSKESVSDTSIETYPFISLDGNLCRTEKELDIQNESYIWILENKNRKPFWMYKPLLEAHTYARNFQEMLNILARNISFVGSLNEKKKRRESIRCKPAYKDKDLRVERHYLNNEQRKRIPGKYLCGKNKDHFDGYIVHMILNNGRSYRRHIEHALTGSYSEGRLYDKRFVGLFLGERKADDWYEVYIPIRAYPNMWNAVRQSFSDMLSINHKELELAKRNSRARDTLSRRYREFNKSALVHQNQIAVLESKISHIRDRIAVIKALDGMNMQRYITREARDKYLSADDLKLRAVALAVVDSIGSPKGTGKWPK